MLDPIDPPRPPRPNLPGRVVVRPTPDEAIEAAAADLYLHALNCVRAFGDFHVALSGGSTPEPLYRLLMIDPAYREMPWKRTHLWVVDERRVPFDDERSNFGMIRQTIVDHSDIPGEQVHPIRAMDAEPDAAYERELREQLEWREKGHDRLDYVLLGMGADGHTASLFPGSPALADQGRLVLVNAGPSVTPPDRVTMTWTLINAARFVAVLVVGEKKRAMVERLSSRRGTSRELPIMGVRPKAGELTWYMDEAAAGAGLVP